MTEHPRNWPEFLQSNWSETQSTLQLWTQIVGKIRLGLEPMVNHWWNVALYVSARGLTTSPMQYHDGRSFSIEFDFCSHFLRIDVSHSEPAGFPLELMSVAAFYDKLMKQLQILGFQISINRNPSEIANAIPFDQDTVHASYDRSQVDSFFRILQHADRLSKIFRARFLGKASPVHFFWGSFDLATTRFSGRTAPVHPGGIPNLSDTVTREAYSHEEHSVGFWPGGFGMEAMFYAYAYPEPGGFSRARISPNGASWNAQLKEFVLPYEAVRTAADPDSAVLEFFQSTYDAAADAGDWDRKLLER